ncbi:NAC domain-containing protein 35 [Ricinus communis]|uniref:NAC domain-containing protein, putative n=1 Tax=Ricinus communis TaxID=3988 RepID=B9S056_RICCO|nr:NAC domain-containing protein 35 [Ricinus communis]EEF42992.1 NAC domain-containing protein, putative [Ricinus communis]|eukprot:XP_002519375.1 NAC domain-containing protein 35 [Ricinus communis]
MAIAATMSLTANHDDNPSSNTSARKHHHHAAAAADDDDDHEHDMVMPGFRFHPTEEELVEFYLRRKVEGKRFNVELITFLDLYRYDPWELPALAAIGEKEWFFYVPRDRKYRNGDRPNRVTTSGYWKATGADRMIRSENSRSIGLKKTLVFYSGKAPKGIRTSWIMNEYRLPQHETERYQKAEISLCRVYKRAGVEDHPSLPRSLSSRASSSRGLQSDKKLQPPQLGMESFQVFGGGGQSISQQIELEKISAETDGSSSSDVTTALGLSKPANVYHPVPAISTSLGLPATIEEEAEEIFLNQSRQACSLVPNNNNNNLFTGSSSVSSNPVDDLHRLVNYQQACISQQQQQYYNTHHHQHHQQQQQQQHQHSQFSIMAPQSQSLALNMLPNSLPTAFPERLWEWNPLPEANRDQYNVNNPFK